MTVTLTFREFFGPVVPDPSTPGLFTLGPGGRAKELGADPAVTRIVLTDAVVFKSGGTDTYYVGGLGSFPAKYWARLDRHTSRLSAALALEAVTLEYARELAAEDVK
jgi:hypothetical protein